MDFKQLTAFVTTVQEGNISKAAHKLNISQPPLSTKLKELEAELGVTLFERGPRQIELTQAGRIFYRRATAILELLALSQSELNDYKLGKSGTLRIGIVSSVSSTLINEWLSAFHKRYPYIHFNIFEGNTYTQLDKLRSNLIEVAIVRTPFSADDLDCTLLRAEKVYAIGKASFFQDTNTFTIQSLASHPLILYRRWEKIISNLCSEQNFTPNILCLNDDARTTISMAQAGLGIGIVPESALIAINDETLVQKILDHPSLTSNICLLRNPTSYLSTIVENFYDTLVSIL